MFNKKSSVYSVLDYCTAGCVAPIAASQRQLKTIEELLLLPQLLAETLPAGFEYHRSNVIIMQITHHLINTHDIYREINP